MEIDFVSNCAYFLKLICFNLHFMELGFGKNCFLLKVISFKLHFRDDISWGSVFSNIVSR